MELNESLVGISRDSRFSTMDGVEHGDSIVELLDGSDRVDDDSSRERRLDEAANTWVQELQPMWNLSPPAIDSGHDCTAVKD
ncbi:hypothetical protein HAX54_025127 [Datura stramonium]|uniref:Uncharacterized protein n=1 Tax=Datura stramonium TaxID=4076 RepID=A0ABS8S626_DATST|nr:hypothetical protein [Datura stramonium]